MTDLFIKRPVATAAAAGACGNGGNKKARKRARYFSQRLVEVVDLMD